MAKRTTNQALSGAVSTGLPMDPAWGWSRTIAGSDPGRHNLGPLKHASAGPDAYLTRSHHSVSSGANQWRAHSTPRDSRRCLDNARVVAIPGRLPARFSFVRQWRNTLRRARHSQHRMPIRWWPLVPAHCSRLSSFTVQHRRRTRGGEEVVQLGKERGEMLMRQVHAVYRPAELEALFHHHKCIKRGMHPQPSQ
jgi:hypothetical protein